MMFKSLERALRYAEMVAYLSQTTMLVVYYEDCAYPYFVFRGDNPSSFTITEGSFTTTELGEIIWTEVP